MLQLRDYQEKVYHKIIDAFGRVRVVLAVVPTGGGKTVIFSKLIHDWRDGYTMAVVHRKEILGQISLALGALEVKHRILAPSSTLRRIRRRHVKKYGRSWIDERAPCAVASVQTLASKRASTDLEIKRFVNQVRLGVFDEGHHYTDAGHWGRAVDMLEASKLLFVTATPERADGKGLHVNADGYVEEMIEGPSVEWLMGQGYLCRYKYFCPESDLDVSGIAVTASGDFNAKALRARIVDSNLIGDVVQHSQRFAAGLKTIVFSTDVKTAEEQADAYNAAGITAAALSGETDDAVRDQAVDEFEFSELEKLVNVNLFDEGFDVPGAVCAIHARPTESIAKYMQINGRVFRPVYAKGYDLSTREGRLAAIANGPKPYAVIIDPVKNWERHGLPDWPRVWNIHGRKAGGTGPGDTIAQRVCIDCTQPYPAYLSPCPYCGAEHKPEGRSEPVQVDGDLAELDVDALRALFDKQREADMSREDFARGLFVPNSEGKIVPPPYHGRLIRKHEAAKYRRLVLRNFVAWWVGMQPADRPLAEKHRRFYHRFGIDIATAFTLGEQETDQLIQTIKTKFTKDLKHEL